MDERDLPGLIGCGFGLAVMLVTLAIMLAVGVFISYQLYLSARALPPANRKLPPASMFLLLVPFLNVVWLFVAVIKLSKGYQEYFAANPRPGVGDAGYAIGLGWAIATVCVLVPIAQIFAGLAALILMILYLVKMSQYRAMVGPATAGRTSE